MIPAEEDAARKEALKKVLKRIAQPLQSYFATQYEESAARPPSSMELIDLIWSRIGTLRSKLYLVTYEHLIDGKGFKSPIAIKFSKDVESFARELQNYEFLKKRLEDSVVISVPDLIYSNQALKTIIYFGITGMPYRASPIKREEKNFFVGLALASIHDRTPSTVDIESYVSLFMLALSQVDKNEAWQRKIIELSGPHLEALRLAQCGSMVFGDFHQENILFQLNRTKASLIGQNSTDGVDATAARFPGLDAIGENEDIDDESFELFVIDPEFLVEGPCDRMEDLAAFLGAQLLTEYKQTDRIDQTLKDFKQIYAGYQSGLQTAQIPALHQLYRWGFTLDFHLANYALMSVLTGTGKSTGDADLSVEGRLRMVVYLLTHSPFAKSLSADS